MSGATPLPPVPGAPARRALEAAGIRSLEDLTRLTRNQLLSLHGMGPKAFGVLDEAMNEAGLRFAD